MNNGATKKALDVIDDAIVDDIPMKGDKIDLPEYRKALWKQQRATMLVQKSTMKVLDTHIKSNDEDLKKYNKRLQKQGWLGLLSSIVILGFIVGIHWGFEWAGGVAGLGGIIGVVTKIIPLFK